MLALGLGAVSGWLLKDTYEFRNQDSTKVVNAFGDLASTVNKAFGGGDIDPDKVSRIKLACAGTAFGGAVLQLLTSLLLLCCSSAKVLLLKCMMYYSKTTKTILINYFYFHFTTGRQSHSLSLCFHKHDCAFCFGRVYRLFLHGTGN